MVFIGRREELELFENRFRSRRSELVFLYGRRRVGKTEFLRKFTEDKKALFFSATEAPAIEQRERFKQTMLSFGFDGDPALLNDWENIFRNLKKLRYDGKILVIIDEFQYLFIENRSIASILQNVWDEYLSKENIMIVLCGSAMSFIEDEVLGGKNPLYGRAGAIFKMKEMTFEEAAQFFPDYTLKEKIIVYAILGGIPFYLEQFSPDLSIEENIKKNIFSPETALFNETELMLRRELRETVTYNAIISAIALGNTRLNEIGQKTMIDAAKANVYLKNLIGLNMVVKEYSILDTIKQTANVRNGLYAISDNFFRFWYRFVYLNKGIIESRMAGHLAKEIMEDVITNYTSICFEKLCIDHIRKMNAARKLPFIAKHVGRIWEKGFEIDVGATDGRTMLLGECKWTNSAAGIEVLNGLREKVTANKELSGYERYMFCLFSKSGFTQTVKDEAKRNGDIILADPEDMFTGSA
jgi:AAA+ ATPase superfamily predicted ATPase